MDTITDRFLSFSQNVVFAKFKFFFQLDHQVDISLYLTKANALYYYRELASLSTSLCTFNPIGLLPSATLKSDF